ncbi:MAG TPA: DUF4290 domain-containing protein [Bacteroidetes bacterium]|nr:DUF4290 domain-containing protein [Bacteroidota bacterium]
MEYNTTREKLRIPGYGRNVQKMIEQTALLEDREQRNRTAYAIVSIMSQINPGVRESSDYQRTLWDHMIIISGFKLEVDGPFPPPSREKLMHKPEKIPYSEGKIKYRHYGKNIEDIIKKAIDYEGEDKMILIKTIANHMKKSYLAWNRESVNDATIFKHLKELSGGKLELPEDTVLTSTSEFLSRNKQKRTKPHQPRRSNNGGRRKSYGQRNF